MENKDLVELIKESNKFFIINELIPFLKIPSFTLNKEGINQAINFIIKYISEFSDDIQKIEGEVNPLIIAKVSGKIKTPILIYMMYDTQPVNELKKWESQPFQADIKKIPEFNNLGNCIIARGAYNSKTPLLSFLNIIKILKQKENLPISLFLVFDGEEEIGSPTFLKLISTKKSLFENCTHAYYPSTKQDIDGKAIIKLGYKGLISFSLRTTSKNKQVHSAYNNIIPNPCLDLLRLIDIIFKDNKIQIKSLSEEYKPLQKEQELLEKLSLNKDLGNILLKAGINQYSAQDSYQLFFNYLFKPTFNISTLKSGYLKEGIKNSIPNSALCNIDIRFAHQQSVDIIFDEISRLILSYSRNLNSDVEIIKNSAIESSRIDIDSVLVKSILKSYDKLEIQSEIWPISAAAAPLSKINTDLGMEYIAAGLGIGGNAHTYNEFIQFDSIIDARLSYFYFLFFCSEDLNF
ncbi:MAG: M20/M25/M40 family metallo-hydrolase [Candidatus Lokiarchaeota archaeon]|nr:M20/M25/M40 family metallo-hydrolase [Candidatus Lokiarchaeota archaeon]